MHQHYHWSGMKADISAFVRKCHPCQVRHLDLHHVAEVRLSRMSCPFQHVHIDLAGPFPLRQVTAPPGRGPHGRTKTALSTTVVGSAFICLVVDYFTKAAELLFLPDKTALSVAKVFHDGWLMRYGLLESLTSDNGTEFQGAFRHQLERFDIEHVLTSSYHPQSNGAAERLV
jgi:transposase InsO family protein